MMRKFSNWFICILTLVLGFTSCEENEEFDGDPKVEIVVDNQEGSAVYSFEAKTTSVNDDAQVIWSVNGNDLEGEDQENIINQILEYLFKPGTHTICVRVVTQQSTIDACVDIEVGIDENDPCPDLFFKSKLYEGKSTYKFIADFKGVDSLSYGWFINDELVEDSALGEDNYLIWNFAEPGRYEVCIKTETPDCPEGTSYCKEIIVEERNETCPEVSFLKEMEPGTAGTYVFEAKIGGVNEVSEIAWYVNDELIENTTGQQGGNRVLVHQFEPGEHKICLKVSTPDCPEGVKYCKEIRVEGDGGCPELSFEKERDGDKAAYYFYPRAFDGIDDVTLEWFVNGNYVGSSPEFPHNNPFYHKFDGPGRYEVCLMVETPDCPNGRSFCKVIEIEGACPNLSFEIEQEGSTPGYNFYANFEGIKELSYEWTINGEVIDREILGSNDDKDDYMYYQFGSGTYEICIQAETPNCPNGIKFCKTLTVE